MKTIFKAAILLFVITAGCSRQTESEQPEASTTGEGISDELNFIFPKGQQGSPDFFTGNAFNVGLLPMDSVYTTLIGNVYFEPGARSNWHSHPAGQILVITDGVGYHKIDGQPKQTLRKGDVVTCPPNTKHWHGASEDTGLQQMYIIPNTEKGIVEWMEPVTDEEYAAE